VFAPGVESDDRIPQKFAVKMGVDLRSQDGFMSQHLLHGTQVSPPVNKLSGKGMPECMRTDILLYTSGSNEVLDHGKNHHPRQLSPPPVEKKYILVIPLDPGQGMAVWQVTPDLLQGNPPDRYQPLFMALSCDPDECLVKIYMG